MSGPLPGAVLDTKAARIWGVLHARRQRVTSAWPCGLTSRLTSMSSRLTSMSAGRRHFATGLRLSPRSIVPTLDALLAATQEEPAKIGSHSAPGNGHQRASKLADRSTDGL